MAEPTKRNKPSCLLYLLLAIVALILISSVIILFLIISSRDFIPSSRNSTNLSIFMEPRSTISTNQRTLTRTKATEEARLLTTSELTLTTDATTTQIIRTDLKPKLEEKTTSLVIKTTTERILLVESTLEVTTLPVQVPNDSTLASVVGKTLNIDTTSHKGSHMTTTEIPSTTSEIKGETTEELFENVHMKSIQQKREVIDKCSSIVAKKISCSRRKDDVSMLPISTFSPLHYSLNLTIKSIQPTVLGGDVQIFFRMNEDGKQISLNIGKELRDVEDINVVSCETGATLCVSKSVFDTGDEQLYLILSDVVSKNSTLRIDFNKFSSISRRDLIYSQIPPHWDRSAPTMIGSLLTFNSSRKIFPSFDNAAYKTTLDLCIRHPVKSQVRSNSDMKWTDKGETCFERTVPLATQQFTFASFEKAETLIYNSTVLNGAYVPAIEIVFSLNKNFKREKHNWIYNETSKVISLLSRWTGFSFPLKKLNLISAPIPVSGHAALGVITLQDRLIEYPSYTIAHVSLIKDVIREWIQVVSIRNSNGRCFEETLTTYLEWKINEEVNIVNKTRAEEVRATRPKDLSKEGIDIPRIMHSSNHTALCTDRYVPIFYTLDETFGPNTVTGMIKEIFDKFAFSTTDISDWQSAVVKSSGNWNAGKMIGEWFSRSSRPVLMATVKAQMLFIEQLTENIWTIPLEIGGSNGIKLFTVSEKNQSIPYVSHDYIILDPLRKSTAIILYDIDSFIRIIRCWDDSRCVASQEAVKGIIKDLGAALLADMLPAPRPVEIPKWKSLFKFILIHRLLDGDSMCCISSSISLPIDHLCTWVVRDTCPKIRLINSIIKGM